MRLRLLLSKIKEALDAKVSRMATRTAGLPSAGLVIHAWYEVDKKRGAVLDTEGRMLK